MFEAFHIRSRPDLPVYRPINNVAVIVRVAGLYGIDPRKLLEGSGIDIADVEDPHKIITTLQELYIDRRGLQLIPEPWIGLELGRHFHLGAKGKLGIAAMCCENGIEALKLLITYIDLASTHFQYEIWTEGETGYARMRELVRFKDIRRYICEAEMASLYTMTSLIMENAAVFKELHIAYPAPAYAGHYRDIFHCPVNFGAPEHMITFDAGLLFKPLKLANPLAKKVLEQECAQLCTRLREHTSITDKIRHELSFGQCDYPTLEQLARRINLSPRTIRRHLTTEATSYKDILSDLRRLQALEMIQSTDLPMEKIALKLGYSDVANFYHAFKGWTGSTPGSFRKPGIV
jgi:AraC-like DNA-binding protein